MDSINQYSIRRHILSLNGEDINYFKKENSCVKDILKKKINLMKERSY